MGSLYRRLKRRRWYLKYRNAAGKWVYEAGYVDRRASEQLLAQREREVERGEVGLSDPYREHRRTPLTQHIQDFLVHLRARGVTERYLRNVEGCLTRALAAMGITVWDAPSSQKAERFLLSLREGDPRKNRKGLSARSINAYLEALREFAAWGVERGRWPVNSFLGLKKLNVEADRRLVRRALTVPELRKVIEAAPLRGVARYRETHLSVPPELAARLGRLGAERAVIYEVMSLTGLRVREVKTLEWQHLNFDRAPATLTVAAQHAKSRRTDTILLPDGAAERLLAWRERRAQELGRLPLPGERVFRVPRGLLEQFKADCAFAGVPLVDGARRVVDLHALRHSFAQMLVREGVHPRTAQTMLRHRDIRTTMAIYVRDDLTAQSTAVAALPALGGGHEVQQNVQQLAHPAAQGGAAPCKADAEEAGRKSKSVEARGENMQEAAAQRSGLQLVGDTGLEPVTSTM